VTTDREAVVAAIHGADLQIVLAVTGGGAAAITDLLGVPGASRTVLEVTVPYATSSLAEMVGGDPDQATSVATARAMAIACRGRAATLAEPDTRIGGVGCTAALVTDRPKRGEHRAHVAVATDGSIASWSLTLDKGARDRSGEDRVVADMVLRAIATASGVAGPLPV
jgi:hypothetical protein